MALRDTALVSCNAAWTAVGGDTMVYAYARATYMRAYLPKRFEVCEDEVRCEAHY